MHINLIIYIHVIRTFYNTRDHYKKFVKVVSLRRVDEEVKKRKLQHLTRKMKINEENND